MSFRNSLIGLSIVLFSLLSCHVSTEPGEATLDITGDSVYLAFERFTVVLQDSAGNPLSGSRSDTLIDKRLTSLDQLKNLSASEYQGGRLRILLRGYQEGVLVYEETRLFDSRNPSLVHREVKPIPTGNGNPGLVLQPDDLRLYAGGGPARIGVHPETAWSEKVLTWSSDHPSIAGVDSQGTVTPGAVGETWVRAASDSARDSARVTVILDAPVVDVGSPDTAILIHSAGLSFRVRVDQEYGGVEVFAWDTDGDGRLDDSASGFPSDQIHFITTPRTYSREGEFTLSFHVRDGEGNRDSATKKLIVLARKPVLAGLTKDTLLTIKDSLTFSASGSVNAGSLARFTWDYQGDGVADDSGSLSGSSADLVGGYRYPAAGRYEAVLTVLEEMGAAVTARVVVFVSQDRPVSDAGKDTAVTVSEWVRLKGAARDTLGRIVKLEWKIGDGPFAEVARADTAFLAPAFPGSLVCLFRVTDDDGQATVDTSRVAVHFRSENRLAGLVLSAGVLDQEFDPDVNEHSAAVGYSDSLLTVLPTLSDSAARITINGQPVASGTPSPPIRVGVGLNPSLLRIVVTAQDSKTQKIYVVSIRRAFSDNALLAGLSVPGLRLDSSFSPMVAEYTDTVPYGTTHVIMTPTASHPAAAITVDGMAATSGIPMLPRALALGGNRIRLTVTAQDGITVRTYALRIERLVRLVVEVQPGSAGIPLPRDSVEVPLFREAPITAPTLVGYHFTHWSGGGGTLRFTDSARSSTMATVLAGAGRARAHYDTNAYPLVVMGNGHGTTAPAGARTAKHFVPVPIEATPEQGYHFVGWVRTQGTPAIADAKAAKTEVTLSDTAAIRADFAINSYSLTLARTGEGSVQPANPATVQHGVALGIAALAAEGYRFVKWSVSGPVVVADAGASGTLATVTGSGAEIKAEFVRLVYSLEILSAGNGSTLPNGTLSASHGVAYPISAKPNTGYHFTRWVAAGKVSVGNVSSDSTLATVTGPGAGLTAEFAETRYTLSISATPCASASNVSVQQGVPSPITTVAYCSPCSMGPPRFIFKSWKVVSGQASLGDAAKLSTTATLGSGNATLEPQYTTNNCN